VSFPGKFDESAGSEVAEPIPIDHINREHEKAYAAAMQQQTAMDDAAAAAGGSNAAAAKKTNGKKGKKGQSDAAAAVETEQKDQAAASAAAAAAPSKPVEQTTDNFVFQPPTEMPPHVCACLMPKKGQLRSRCCAALAMHCLYCRRFA
jgi:hypothetical protein